MANVTATIMSTISPALSRRLAERHRAAGQAYLAAPVFGRPEAAEAKKLWIVVAGPAAAIDRCRPLLDAMGQGTIAVGEDPARANVIKVAGNLLIAAAIEAMGEAVALGRKYGIAPAELLDVVNGRVFRSPLYENYGKLIADERYEPAGFKLKHGLKDARLALAAGDEVAGHRLGRPGAGMRSGCRPVSSCDWLILPRSRGLPSPRRRPGPGRRSRPESGRLRR